MSPGSVHDTQGQATAWEQAKSQSAHSLTRPRPQVAVGFVGAVGFEESNGRSGSKEDAPPHAPSQIGRGRKQILLRELNAGEPAFWLFQKGEGV